MSSLYAYSYLWKKTIEYLRKSYLLISDQEAAILTGLTSCGISSKLSLPRIWKEYFHMVNKLKRTIIVLIQQFLNYWLVLEFCNCGLTAGNCEKNGGGSNICKTPQVTPCFALHVFWNVKCLPTNIFRSYQVCINYHNVTQKSNYLIPEVQGMKS